MSSGESPPMAEQPGANKPPLGPKLSSLRGLRGLRLGASLKQDFVLLDGQLFGPGLPADAAAVRVVRVGGGSTFRRLGRSLGRGDDQDREQDALPTWNLTAGQAFAGDASGGLLAAWTGPVLLISKTIHAGGTKEELVNFQLQYSTSLPAGGGRPSPTAVEAAAPATPLAAPPTSPLEWRAVPGVTADASVDLARFLGSRQDAPCRADLRWPTSRPAAVAGADYGGRWTSGYLLKVSVVHVTSEVRGTGLLQRFARIPYGLPPSATGPEPDSPLTPGITTSTSLLSHSRSHSHSRGRGNLPSRAGSARSVETAASLPPLETEYPPVAEAAEAEAAEAAPVGEPEMQATPQKPPPPPRLQTSPVTPPPAPKTASQPMGPATPEAVEVPALSAGAAAAAAPETAAGGGGGRPPAAAGMAGPEDTAGGAADVGSEPVASTATDEPITLLAPPSLGLPVSGSAAEDTGGAAAPPASPTAAGSPLAARHRGKAAGVSKPSLAVKVSPDAMLRVLQQVSQPPPLPPGHAAPLHPAAVAASEAIAAMTAAAAIASGKFESATGGASGVRSGGGAAGVRSGGAASSSSSGVRSGVVRLPKSPRAAAEIKSAEAPQPPPPPPPSQAAAPGPSPAEAQGTSSAAAMPILMSVESPGGDDAAQASAEDAAEGSPEADVEIAPQDYPIVGSLEFQTGPRLREEDVGADAAAVARQAARQAAATDWAPKGAPMARSSSGSLGHHRGAAASVSGVSSAPSNAFVPRHVGGAEANDEGDVGGAFSPSDLSPPPPRSFLASTFPRGPAAAPAAAGGGGGAGSSAQGSSVGTGMGTGRPAAEVDVAPGSGAAGGAGLWMLPSAAAAGADPPRPLLHVTTTPGQGAAASPPAPAAAAVAGATGYGASSSSSGGGSPVGSGAAIDSTGGASADGGGGEAGPGMWVLRGPPYGSGTNSGVISRDAGTHTNVSSGLMIKPSGEVTGVLDLHPPAAAPDLPPPLAAAAATPPPPLMCDLYDVGAGGAETPRSRGLTPRGQAAGAAQFGSGGGDRGGSVIAGFEVMRAVLSGDEVAIAKAAAYKLEVEAEWAAGAWSGPEAEAGAAEAGAAEPPGFPLAAAAAAPAAAAGEAAGYGVPEQGHDIGAGAMPGFSAVGSPSSTSTSSSFGGVGVGVGGGISGGEGGFEGPEAAESDADAAQAAAAVAAAAAAAFGNVAAAAAEPSSGSVPGPELPAAAAPSRIRTARSRRTPRRQSHPAPRPLNYLAPVPEGHESKEDIGQLPPHFFSPLSSPTAGSGTHFFSEPGFVYTAELLNAAAAAAAAAAGSSSSQQGALPPGTDAERQLQQQQQRRLPDEYGVYAAQPAVGDSGEADLAEGRGGGAAVAAPAPLPQQQLVRETILPAAVKHTEQWAAAPRTLPVREIAVLRGHLAAAAASGAEGRDEGEGAEGEEEEEEEEEEEDTAAQAGSSRESEEAAEAELDELLASDDDKALVLSGEQAGEEATEAAAVEAVAEGSGSGGGEADTGISIGRLLAQKQQQVTPSAGVDASDGGAGSEVGGDGAAAAPITDTAVAGGVPWSLLEGDGELQPLLELRSDRPHGPAAVTAAAAAAAAAGGSGDGNDAAAAHGGLGAFPSDPRVGEVLNDLTSLVEHGAATSKPAEGSAFGLLPPAAPNREELAPGLGSNLNMSRAPAPAPAGVATFLVDVPVSELEAVPLLVPLALHRAGAAAVDSASAPVAASGGDHPAMSDPHVPAADLSEQQPGGIDLAALLAQRASSLEVLPGRSLSAGAQLAAAVAAAPALPGRITSAPAGIHGYGSGGAAAKLPRSLNGGGAAAATASGRAASAPSSGMPALSPEGASALAAAVLGNVEGAELGAGGAGPADGLTRQQQQRRRRRSSAREGWLGWWPVAQGERALVMCAASVVVVVSELLEDMGQGRPPAPYGPEEGMVAVPLLRPHATLWAHVPWPLAPAAHTAVRALVALASGGLAAFDALRAVLGWPGLIPLP
ncbi:hypothetical protein PLESTB_000522400 [Pleodorina starrii]|uniref:Uncharacterized protein n=1 Tax=Pleodorina starrii TaxID=330485 RepID=A0A9W6BH06_9CHLO|nr:hypothetical protein PLESTM_000385900 [Pleodorina starrii]GLC51623.1 hypothetical protein PLESTB_000522400 [Pleodorina starrii]GLC72393.1 hypothetical protein PLESTF_001242800 [Pleodorina starrii]